MQGPDTRPTLIRRLAESGCQEAWTEFVGLYQPAIFRVARRRGLQHADAEDLTQDVLARVGRKVGEFNLTESGSFRGWLGKITRDMVIDRFRKRTTDAGSGDSVIHEQLAQMPAREDTATLIRAEVRREQLLRACERIRCQFSEPVWLSFWLTAIELQSIAAVAEQLNRTEGAVRVARCRVMSRLKEEVEEHDCPPTL